MRLKKNEYYAGFSDDKLDSNLIDLWSGIALCPALFKDRQAARDMYEDVRKVRVTEVK